MEVAIPRLSFQKFNMDIFIKSICTISPQDTFLKDLPETLVEYPRMLQSRLPDFSVYFDPIEMRRMNRVLRSGNTCSIEALKEAGVSKPDAIIMGTGVGSVMDTERFLNNMLDNDETLLTPTAFINSTHNTLSAQIAISSGCQGYNMVYVHKTISFELALADAVLTIQEGEGNNILVGGVDELTEENYKLKEHIHLWKEMPCSNLDILHSKTPGSVPGEGFAFMMLGTDASGAKARLKEVISFYSPKTEEKVIEFFHHLLNRNGWKANEIDLVFTGINGDQPNDAFYYKFVKEQLPESTHAYYKHMCGEYDTASSFAVWLTVKLFDKGNIPAYLLVDDKKRSPKKVLIYNQDKFKNHSFILLEQV